MSKERIQAAIEAIQEDAVEVTPAIVRLAAVSHLIAPGLVNFGDCDLDTLAEAFTRIAEGKDG